MANEEPQMVRESMLLVGETVSDEEAPLSEQTQHIVQPFRMMTVRTKNNRKKSVLTPMDPLSVIGEGAARERAERMFDTGNYAGIDAFTSCDKESSNA